MGAQNGHFDGAPPICQAMVRENGQRVVSAPTPAINLAASVLTPQPARPKPKPKPRIVRPPRPRVAVTARNLAIFLGVVFCGAFLADALIFRTDLYTPFLEPQSTTGYVERIVYTETHRPPTGKKEVLVLGNSRIAEAFSARIANEYQQDGYWFLNCAFLASTARPWYYFVRDIDPQRNRYAAIAIPIDDYSDSDLLEDPTDRALELKLVINRLRVTDILPFTFSFPSWASRFEVARGSTFKGVGFQLDLQEFIEHPAKRLKDASDYRLHGADWIYGYGGDSHSLAGLSVDWAHRRVTFPPGMPQDDLLAKLILAEPRQTGSLRDFQIKWLGALVDLYRGSKTKIIIYQVPRNLAPRPTPLAHWPSTTVDELRKRPWVKIIDPTVFEPLEKPELFFDYIHLNADGRKLFSPLLADTVKAALQ